MDTQHRRQGPQRYLQPRQTIICPLSGPDVSSNRFRDTLGTIMTDFLPMFSQHLPKRFQQRPQK